MEIEVTWEVKPKSGITFIDISDLGCKTKKMWDSLTKSEQLDRINAYLMQTDYPTLKPIAIEW